MRSLPLILLLILSGVAAYLFLRVPTAVVLPPSKAAPASPVIVAPDPQPVSKSTAVEEIPRIVPDPPAVKVYHGRVVAQTMHWSGAEWLQRVTREAEENGTLMRTQLEVKPGMTICDLGSGDGYHTFPLAEAVGDTGLIYAVDIQPEMLDLLQQRAAKRGLKNIKSIVGLPWSPQLPTASQDIILLVDVYHEFSHPEHMLREMHRSLKPDGRIALVEFRSEDPEVPIKTEHKMSKEQILKEFLPMGFKLVKTFDELPWQHLMFFGKDGNPPPAPK
jgi:ubiquinone/menaquinone biosynthesis C-methylase UbiE